MFVVCDIAELEPGSVGLALSYAMTLTGMFQWGVRQSAEIENMVRLFTLCKFMLFFFSLRYLSAVNLNRMMIKIPAGVLFPISTYRKSFSR